MDIRPFSHYPNGMAQWVGLLGAPVVGVCHTPLRTDPESNNAYGRMAIRPFIQNPNGMAQWVGLLGAPVVGVCHTPLRTDPESDNA